METTSARRLNQVENYGHYDLLQLYKAKVESIPENECLLIHCVQTGEYITAPAVDWFEDIEGYAQETDSHVKYRFYDITDVKEFTGLSDSAIYKHISQGLLHGRKAVGESGRPSLFFTGGQILDYQLRQNGLLGVFDKRFDNAEADHSDLFFSTQEVADKLGWHRQTVQKKCRLFMKGKSGGLQCVQLENGQYRIPAIGLDELPPK